MNQNDFFIFSSKLSSSTFQAHLVDLNTDHLKLIKGDYTGMNFPVILKHKYGTKLLDILDTGSSGFFLISDKMKNVLEENKLTGWKKFPIKIYGVNNKEISGYHGFSITGRCESISFEKSKIIEKQLVPNGPICRYYRGVTIEKWDGTDFFSPENKYRTFISNKTAEILKKNKITNVRIESLSDYEIDLRYVKNNC